MVTTSLDSSYVKNQFLGPSREVKKKKKNLRPLFSFFPSFFLTFFVFFLLFIISFFPYIAGIGLGRLLGREHASTLQSGVEAPRLLKRSLSPDCIVVVVVVSDAVFHIVCMCT